jgi:hypothetical protein
MKIMRIWILQRARGCIGWVTIRRRPLQRACREPKQTPESGPAEEARMSTTTGRRPPTPILAEDLADAWSSPRARDLTYLPLPPREPPKPAPDDEERGEAA